MSIRTGKSRFLHILQQVRPVCKTRNQFNKKSIAQAKKIDLDELPIPLMRFSITQDKASHDWIVKLVSQMLSLHQQQAMAKTAHEKILLQRQIDDTDGHIDQLVYQLYQLTAEEISIVEGATPKA